MVSPDRVSIVYHPDLCKYDFGPHHPLRPERITLGLDLLADLGIWNQMTETSVAVLADDAVLGLIHSENYVLSVRASAGGRLSARELERYGLSSSDNPPFNDMHFAAALVAGGAADAARSVMRGELDHIFHPAGGLHHARQARASGFCIYNDPALAAAVAVEEFGARVAYVDFDCHHGDGVQWLFYDDPSVLTISFHESGKFLFPGTGGVDERGAGNGLGYAANVPVLPFTRDASWLHAIHSVVPPLLERFAPDLLLSVHGCDTHSWDPLTHLCLSTSAFVDQARMSHTLAHRHTSGRWVAFGSGGYDWRRVVPRSWAILWAEMSGRELPDELPTSWLRRWEKVGSETLTRYFVDPLEPAAARAPELESANRETVMGLLRANGLH